MPETGGIGRANDPRLPRERRIDDAAAPAGRALVPVRPVAATDGPHEGSRRSAPAFLAHLAATRQRAPQTRAGRRADPAEAVAAYGAALIPPAMTGRMFRRSV